jgi:hypothetical protein
MAFYLDIKKIRDLGSCVEYAYELTDGRHGLFSIDVVTGQTTLISAADNEIEERLYQRAAFKISTFWASGSLPEKTCWAS